MKKALLKKLTAFTLAAAMVMAIPTAAYADAPSTESTEAAESAELPYLCLGDDLTADEQHTALALLGVDASQLDQYQVSYVTNKEEHKYLDSYIPSEKIGTRALSCVMITKTAEGSGITVETYNINYCTEGMYRNALETAGVEDADVKVAGPFAISGTAALLGTFEAYSQMTGEKFDDDVVDVALDELVTTGELEESLEDVDPEIVESVIADLKQFLADGRLDKDEDIMDAIAEEEEKYGVYFTDEEKQNIVNLVNKYKDVDLDWLEGVYKAGIFTKVGNFFSDLWGTFKSWFS